MDKLKFIEEKIKDIFRVSEQYSDRLKSRESSTLEFKEAFGFMSLAKYLKTSAAYANNKGGFIVFGIPDRPHLIKGLPSASFSSFENLDPQVMSNHFNEHFSPEIKWHAQIHIFKGKKFGVLYIEESSDKPVVCRKDSKGILKEGDIYYRYSGRSERIKYSELKNILESKRLKEQELWMNHLQKMATIGIQDVGVFNLKNGMISGHNGAFYIDESLLSQLSFIKEGEFSEVEGKATLKLVGELKVSSNESIKLTRNRPGYVTPMTENDVIINMLKGANVKQPDTFIAQICRERTAFLPVYYYIKKLNKKLRVVIEIINSLSIRSISRKKLIKRLENNESQKMLLSSNSTHPSTLKRRRFVEQLKGNEIDSELRYEDIKDCLIAIRSLKREDVKEHHKYINELLLCWFNRYYANAESSLAGEMRRAICWVDEALYKIKIKRSII